MQILNCKYANNGRAIAALIAHRGKERIMHENISASLFMANMVSDKAEMLAMTTAGYDELRKDANSKNLVDTIVAFTTA